MLKEVICYLPFALWLCVTDVYNGMVIFNVVIPAQTCRAGNALNRLLGQYGIDSRGFILKINEVTTFWAANTPLNVNVIWDKNLKLRVRGVPMRWVLECLYRKHRSCTFSAVKLPVRVVFDIYRICTSLRRTNLRSFFGELNSYSVGLGESAGDKL